MKCSQVNTLCSIKKGHLALIALLLSFSLVDEICAQQAHGATAKELLKFDIEQLVDMEVEVKSAGKTPSRALDLPYAAHVITAQDIEKSGALTIPEVLRLAPGLTVNRISAAEWSVGIRGIGGRFSGYVLVLVDGRSVYNTEFGGVNWDEVNLPVETISRIEIIRGPNASAWGPNAVNGIINIITTLDNNEEQNSINVWAGSESHVGISGSWNTQLQNQWLVSVNAQLQEQNGLRYSAVLPREDKLKNWRFVSRLSKTHDEKQVSLSLETFGSESSPYFGLVDRLTPEYIHVPTEEKISGSVLQFDFTRTLGKDLSWSLRASLDETDRSSRLYDWHTYNYQIDWDVQGNTNRHQWIFGVNSKLNRSKISTTPPFIATLSPESAEASHLGLFINDNINLAKNLTATVALRVDYNELTATNYQPSTRLLWKIQDNSRAWIAVSRASATPSRLTTDFSDIAVSYFDPLPPTIPLPIVAIFNGNENLLRTTYITSYEAGFRQVFDNFNIDISLFDSHYTNSPLAETSGTPEIQFNQDSQPIAVFIDTTIQNRNEYSIQGTELSSRAQLTPAWAMQLAYSTSKSKDGISNTISSSSIMSSFQISKNLYFNFWLRHQRGYASHANNQLKIPTEYNPPESNRALNFNIQWNITESVAFEFSGHDLGREHSEAIREVYYTYSAIVEPHYLLKMTKSF